MTNRKKPNTDKVIPSDDAPSKGKQEIMPEGSMKYALLMRFWPLFLSAALSITWIGICAWWFISFDRPIAQTPIYEAGGLLAGASLPLILIWLIALVYLRTDPLRDHRMALAHGLDGLLAPLEKAQRRVNSIVAELNKEIKHVEVAGDIATTRIDNLENRFQIQISNLFDVTTDAEAKAVNIQELLSTERQSFITHITEVTEHIAELENLFKQIKFDGESMANSTRKNAEDVSTEITLQNKALEERSKHITEILGTMATELGDMSQDISEKCTFSENKLNDISQIFAEKQMALTDTVAKLSQNTDQICEKMDKQSAIITEISQKTADESTKITTTLLDQGNNLSDIAAEAMALSTKSGEEFNAQTDSMKKKLDEAREFITNQGGEFVENMEQQFTGLMERLNNQTSHFQQFSGETSDKIENTMSAMELQAEKIDVAVTLTTEKLNENTGKMDEHYVSFKRLTEKFTSLLDQSEIQLKNQHDEFINSLSDVAEYIDVSMIKLKDQTGSLGEHTQEIISSIVGQTDQLSSLIDDIRDRTENTTQNIQEMGKMVTQHFTSTDEQAVHLSENWLKTALLVENQCSDTLSRLDDLTAKLLEIEKENTRATDVAEDNISNVADQMEHASESIFLASASAIEAADETNRVIDEHAEKFQQLVNAIQLSNKSILIDAQSIEQKNKDKNGIYFSNLASKIIEQLQSLSIDLNRYFEDDIPDKVWKSYINGDKNTFVRRLKKVTNKKNSTAIRDKYESDPEFRKNALEYIQIFEDLMSQSMASDAYSSFSVALISSETGKVYLALAQAMNRFST